MVSGRFLVGYTGTLGLANSVETIINAAIILKDNDSVGFIIMGTGRLEELLKKRVADHRLQNVQFIEHQSEVNVISVLARLDAALLCWQHNSLYAYGTSAIKMPTYLAAGKPILQAYSGAYDPISKHKLGITVTAEDEQRLAQAILDLQAMDHTARDELGKNALKYAYEIYFFEKLVELLENILLDRKTAPLIQG